jgi:hypothetical protein
MRGSEESTTVYTATKAGDRRGQGTDRHLGSSKLTAPQSLDRPIGEDVQGCASSRLALRPNWPMWLGWWCDEVQESRTKLTRAYSGNRTLN